MVLVVSAIIITVTFIIIIIIIISIITAIVFYIMLGPKLIFNAGTVITMKRIGFSCCSCIIIRITIVRRNCATFFHI